MSKMTKEILNKNVDAQEKNLLSMADYIFDHPELGYKEELASKTLTQYLEDNGFAVTKGVGGLPTAFKAVWKNGEGGPNFGLLCEYDALPKLGHGCGHHMQGPCILGAAVALKEGAGDLPFTITVYGTPGEENYSGKYEMMKNGCTFKELDIALMMHGGPATQTDIKCLAVAKYDVTYHGKAAHAALKPEDGRSSLDGMLLAFHGVETLREHVPSDVRIHYNITDAGGTPANVVPSLTTAEFYVRSEKVGELKGIMARFEKIMNGAALMTETTVDIHVGKILENKIPNFCINDALMANAKALHAPNCQPPRAKTGSTDFANVMRVVPGSCIRVAFVPDGTVSHSDAFVEAGKSQAAHNAVIVGAKILADTVEDFLEQPELLAKAKAELKERKEKEEKEQA